MAFNKPINAVNIDAHTDFRPEEGRHSGNGFSYAFAEGFLKNYYILGLHENYSSRSILNTIKKLKKVRFTSYEDLEVRQDKKLKNALSEALDHVKNSSFGLELDCDAIADIPSSAATPSGFSVKQIRRMIHYFGTQPNVCYFHSAKRLTNNQPDLVWLNNGAGLFTDSPLAARYSSMVPK